MAWKMDCNPLKMACMPLKMDCMPPSVPCLMRTLIDIQASEN
jgi:hypothetical protein